MKDEKYIRFYENIDEDYIPDEAPVFVEENSDDTLPSTIKPIIELNVTEGYTVTYSLMMDISQLIIIRNDDNLKSLRDMYTKLKENKDKLVRMEYTMGNKLIAYDDYKNWVDFHYILMDDGKEKLEIVYLMNQ